MIIQCCVCHKVRQEDGSWKEEDTMDRMDVSHGYCPPCAEKALAEAEKSS